MEAWYVAKTKPAKERITERFLNDVRGVEVFMPLIRRPAGKKNGSELLFPTYIFCLVDPQSADWPAVRWAPGLSYFLGNGLEPVPVPEVVIGRLKQQVYSWNEGGFTPRFASGEKVIVTDGPFSGLEAIFQRYVPARQRCQVLIQVLNKLAQVEIPVEALGNKSPYGKLALAT